MKLLLFLLTFCYTFLPARSDDKNGGDCTFRFQFRNDYYVRCLGEVTTDSEDVALTKLVQNSIQLEEYLKKHKHGRQSARNELCRFQAGKLSCIETAVDITKYCQTPFEEYQFDNQIAGLNAKIQFECRKGAENLKLLDENHEIRKCKENRKLSIDKCNVENEYSEIYFLPIFDHVELHNATLWTTDDCRRKRSWKNCVIGVLDICTDKSSKDYYSKFYSEIVDAYPACQIAPINVAVDDSYDDKEKSKASRHFIHYEFRKILLTSILICSLFIYLN